jgi:hypothetical protein
MGGRARRHAPEGKRAGLGTPEEVKTNAAVQESLFGAMSCLKRRTINQLQGRRVRTLIAFNVAPRSPLIYAPGVRQKTPG